jgi:hypothetical protein
MLCQTPLHRDLGLWITRVERVLCHTTRVGHSTSFIIPYRARDECWKSCAQTTTPTAGWSAYGIAVVDIANLPISKEIWHEREFCHLLGIGGIFGSKSSFGGSPPVTLQKFVCDNYVTFFYWRYLLHPRYSGSRFGLLWS